MNFDLDFVRERGRVSAAGWAWLAVGVAATVYSAMQFRSAQSAYAELEAREAARRDVVSPVPVRHGGEAEVNRLRARLLAARQVVEKRTTPWDALFRDIESASNRGIGLVSIQPDLTTRQVNIAGDARDAAILASYLERLGRTSTLAKVHLTGHEARQEHGRTVIRFNINASWETDRP